MKIDGADFNAVPRVAETMGFQHLTGHSLGQWRYITFCGRHNNNAKESVMSAVRVRICSKSRALIANARGQANLLSSGTESL